MWILSKSKLLAYRQCSKRLWLEVHHPELIANSATTKTNFSRGNQVGAIAQMLYDPAECRHVIDPHKIGFENALEQSRKLFQGRAPIFEAGFQAHGVVAFADVMLPVSPEGADWRVIEVKSTTSVKDYHRDDAAVQAFVARSAGIDLVSISLAHIDSGWVYPGNSDYKGLLVEVDLSEEAFSRGDEVYDWIRSAQTIVESDLAPEVQTGRHCRKPHDCGFLHHCKSSEPQAENPIEWLPGGLSKELIEHIQLDSLTEINDIPDRMLNDRQRMVKTATISGETFFDLEGASNALQNYTLPAYFLDFETIMFGVPKWAGARPYEQIPFQFSIHKLQASGSISPSAFLDISGLDPRRKFSESLLQGCEESGAIFVYNAGFEKSRIKELAKLFPDLSHDLLALNERVVDLLPVARAYYYNPSQHGSWSIKAVLPALCPDLKYSELDGVQDGQLAMDAYLEAIDPDTSRDRKQELERQLLDYCALDTYAMVKMWAVFTNSVVD